MKIVIAGAGKVGFELARFFSRDHEVTVIDKNAEALERLGEMIDIYPVTGAIQNPVTYRHLLEREVDVFVAVTDSDEANILSMLVANDAIRIRRRILRLRNGHYEQSRFWESMGDPELIFPYRLSAETIRLLLKHPEANNVKHFAHTSLKLISIKVDNPLHEAKQVRDFENDRIRIVGIERAKTFRLPDRQETVQHGDLLYFLGDAAVLEALYGQLDLHMPPRIETAAVFGADTLGIAVARILLAEGVSVKIIEKDLTLCHRASDALQERALVINSHYDEAILYEEEHLDRADMIVATDRKDETNILRALQALEHRIPKVVAINNERKHYALMHQMGMVVARGPQMSAYYAILESIARHETIEVRHFCGGEGVVLARTILEGSDRIGHTLRPWGEEGSVWIGRGERLLLPEEEGVLRARDIVFLVVRTAYEEQGTAWIRSF